MKTVESLYQQYGEKYIPAAPVLVKYFGFGTPDKPKEAGEITKLIRANKLHGLRLIRTSKTFYMVNIENLAEVLDNLERA